jgi:hypothetical protein
LDFVGLIYLARGSRNWKIYSRELKSCTNLQWKTVCYLTGCLEVRWEKDLLCTFSLLWRRIAADRLWYSLREAMLMLRSRAYNATNLLKEYQEFFRGLSYSIGVACGNVKELRASVIVSSVKYSSCDIHPIMQDHNRSRTTQDWCQRRPAAILASVASGSLCNGNNTCPPPTIRFAGSLMRRTHHSACCYATCTTWPT